MPPSTDETSPLRPHGDIIMDYKQESKDLSLQESWEARRHQRVCLVLTLVTFMLVGLVTQTIFHGALLDPLQEQASIRRSKDALAYLNRKHESRHQSKVSMDLLNGKSTVSDVAEGCQATVLLVRHCEKKGPSVTDREGDGHCSYLGYQRAAYFSTLFGDDNNTRWPSPSFLFAMAIQRKTHKNFREYEMIVPLARKSGIKIELFEHKRRRSDEHNLELLPEHMFNLLVTGQLCGKLVVVSWKHEYIPEIASQLGCGPKQGCPSVPFDSKEFDETWMIQYVYSPPPVEPYDPLEVKMDDASRHHQRELKDKHKKWHVFATRVKENFDPLSFGKTVGDYPPGGKAVSDGWKVKEQTEGNRLLVEL